MDNNMNGLGNVSSLPQNSPTIPVGGSAGGTGVPGAGGGDAKTEAITKAADVGTGVLDKGVDKLMGDSTPDVKPGEQVSDPNAPKTDEEGNPTEGGGPQKGEKIAPGMEVDENGQAKQSATSRVQGIAAQGAAAYFTKGNAQAMQAAKKVSDSKTGRRIADVVEKAPGAKQVSELAEKTGAVDTAEGALQAYTAFKNKDAKGMMEGAKKVKKGTRRTRIIMMVVTFLIIGLPVFISMAVMAVIANSFSYDEQESTDKVYQNMYDYEWQDEETTTPGDDPGGGGGGGGGGSVGHKLSPEEQQAIIDKVPNFDSLSSDRKSIIRTAVSVVGYGYCWNDPLGPGMSGFPTAYKANDCAKQYSKCYTCPEGGLDCSSLLQWIMWTVYGSRDSAFNSTSTMRSSIGGTFKIISASEALPGDIGLNDGHTGLYLGNGNWIHASGHKNGIVYNRPTFQLYLRYNQTSSN